MDSLFIVSPIVCWGSVLVTFCFATSLVLLSSWHLKRARCFTLIVFLVCCDFKCYLALPHGALGWSAVCDCGIS